jgi:hypothetical protein
MRCLYVRWCALGIVALATGCGGGPAKDAPKTVPVKGVVNYKGQPVPSLSVGFRPLGPGRIANGITDSTGRFELMTAQPGDGAMPGEYEVVIGFSPEEVTPMPGFPGSEKKPVSPIPTKYENPKKSGLKQTVSDDPGKNDFTFDLTD